MIGVSHSELVKFAPKNRHLNFVISKLEVLLEKNIPHVSNRLPKLASKISSNGYNGIFVGAPFTDLTEREFRHGTYPPIRSETNAEANRDNVPRSCRCQCHKQRNIRFPKLLKHYLGYMAMQINYTNRCLTCSFRDCRRLIPATVESQYYFPQWLLARKIYFTICQQSKPGISLFFPNVIPDSSDIFKFCMNGNLEGVQSLFRQKRTWPTDVSYDYGWTALHVRCLICSQSST